MERLLSIASGAGIEVDFLHLPRAESASLQIDGEQYIAMDIQYLFHPAEGAVHLAHEMGHCRTGSFYCMYAAADVRGRHEYRADKWAAHCLVPPEELRRAAEAGEAEPWQLAERFGVTEAFVRRAVAIYRCEGLMD